MEVSVDEQKIEHASSDKKSEIPVISLKNVTKRYITGTQSINALDDVSIDIYDGEFITIQGPSGCGKTTMLNMIGLMDEPTSGIVCVNGIDTSKLRSKKQAKIRLNIGFVFQFYNLIPELTALKNVELPLMAKGLDEKTRIEMAKKMLDLVGIVDRIYNTPLKLSGGEQQRVAIARAIVNEPILVIADEPTGDLDTKTGKKIMDLLLKLNDEHGYTILIVTHDPNVAELGKRRVMMEDGKIVLDSRVED